MDGKLLRMDQSRSLDVPDVGEKGWPALIRGLTITDERGLAIESISVGSKGWELKQAYKGTLKLDYEIDFSGIAAKDWPAPRETAFRDHEHFLFIGRSVFITTPAARLANVEFILPAGWSSVTPWRSSGQNRYAVVSVDDLVANMLVLTNRKPRSISVSGFSVSVTSMGHWQAVDRQIDEVLRSVVPRLVRLIGHSGQGKYSVVLLPIAERGGESYLGSFVYNVADTPTVSNRNEWARLIAHEMFHYWNGWRLRGKDYAATQWFQEGFTDYAADLAMVTSGLTDHNDFVGSLNRHLANYRTLSTPLAAPGNRKGPPLYSGGALAAFCWDVRLRHETRGKRDIGDLFKGLWSRSDKGSREYEWSDIRSVLGSTAHFDWDAFYRKHIEGTETLPLDEILPLAGLKRIQASGREIIELDPTSPPDAKRLRNDLVSGR